MKKTQILTLLASSALVLAGTAAEAQRHNGGHGDRGHRGGMRASMMLLAADANGDNSVTMAEVEALQAEMFAWMDRNGDGYLDDADQSPVRQRLRAHHEARMAEDGEDSERRHHRRGRHGGEDGHHGLRRADANEDGRISREEFMGQEHPMFERLDANEDGTISPDELDAAAEHRQNRGRWWRD